VFRRLLNELGGLAEREFIARLRTIEARDITPHTQARADRLAWIGRQEAAALRTARIRIQRAFAKCARPFYPGELTIGLPEAITIAGNRIGRAFDLMRAEAIR